MVSLCMPFGKSLQIFFGALQIENSCFICDGLRYPLADNDVSMSGHSRHYLVLQTAHEYDGDFGDLWQHLFTVPILMAQTSDIFGGRKSAVEHSAVTTDKGRPKSTNEGISFLIDVNVLTRIKPAISPAS